MAKENENGFHGQPLFASLPEQKARAEAKRRNEPQYDRRVDDYTLAIEPALDHSGQCSVVIHRLHRPPDKQSVSGGTEQAGRKTATKRKR